MKKYQVIITNTKTKEVIVIEELSTTQKYLKSKYDSRHKFDEQKKNN